MPSALFEELLTSVATQKGTAAAIQQVFSTVLQHIDATRWLGACHSSSAILHVLLKERGIDSVIKIGEVLGQGYRFDHSWIEIRSEIFDAAVAYPDEGGLTLSGPVFAGIDLESGLPSELSYGAGQEGGLDTIAKQVAGLSLGGYFHFADQQATVEAVANSLPVPPDLWARASSIGKDCGVSKSPAELALNYFDVWRAVSYAC